jgi:glutathione S-transferase
MPMPQLEGLRVFVFPAAWGLPTNGPFALKLEAWLRLAGIPYERVEEANASKGPKGKSPWIELEGSAMGDSGVIIRTLGHRTGIDLDAWLDPTQRSTALALTRMVEEHLHQVLEYELFVLAAGWSEMRRLIAEALPPIVAPVVGAAVRSQFKKQLRARGVARHDAGEVARQGREDLDAIETLLTDTPWLFGDRPCLADCAVFGQLAPLVFAPFDTPVASHAKASPNIARWCERVRHDLFATSAQSKAA